MPASLSSWVSVVLAAQVLSTVAMAGILALVQWVHYPIFAGLDPEAFREWHAFHSARISPIVAPLMIIELGSAALLVLMLPRTHIGYVTAWGMLILTLGIWVSTFALSVPLHAALSERGFDASLIARLVSTNLVRTILSFTKCVWGGIFMGRVFFQA